MSPRREATVSEEVALDGNFRAYVIFDAEHTRERVEALKAECDRMKACEARR